MSTFPAHLVDELLTASYYNFSLFSIVALQYEQQPIYSKAQDERDFQWRMAAYNDWVGVFEQVFEQPWKTKYDVDALKNMCHWLGAITMTTFYDAEHHKINQKQERMLSSWKQEITRREKAMKLGADLD